MNEINEQQIRDFCKSAERMCHFNKMPSLVAALKIIKQHQAELAAAEEEIKRLRDGETITDCQATSYRQNDSDD